MTDHSAGRRADQFELLAIMHRLTAALGPTLVAVLTGSNDLRMTEEWARPGGDPVSPAAAQRIRFAYEQWAKIAAVEGEDVARLWFIGANPWLDFDTPAIAIREGRFEEVAAAATAMIDDAFGG